MKKFGMKSLSNTRLTLQNKVGLRTEERSNPFECTRSSYGTLMIVKSLIADCAREFGRVLHNNSGGNSRIERFHLDFLKCCAYTVESKPDVFDRVCIRKTKIALPMSS